MSTKKKWIAVTVMLLSLMQMAPTGISPMLAGASEAFQGVSIAKIQFLMTLPGIFVVVFSFLSAWLTKRISKKLLISIGCICILAAGILPVFFHDKMIVLQIWSVILGIGMGLVSALAISLLADYFDENERSGLMGMQSGANNMGAMIMSLIGGLLAARAWYLNYLVFLLVIPGLICCVLFVPSQNEGNSSAGAAISDEKIRINAVMVKYAVVAVVFLFCFNAVPANLAMYIAENNIGNAATAGIASAVSLLGGVLAGMIFGKINAKVKLYTIPLGFLCLGMGLLIMVNAPMLLLFFAGCFIAGAAITFILPQCMMQVTMNASPAQATMATAMIMAAANVGNFLTPLVSTLAEAITNNTLVSGRYLLCMYISLSGAVVMLVVTKIANEKNK